MTRILDINTDAGSTEMHKLEDTDDHTADGGTETTKKQRPTSEDSKPEKQRTVKIEKVCILQGCGKSKISTCPETSHNVLDKIVSVCPKEQIADTNMCLNILLFRKHYEIRYQLSCKQCGSRSAGF